MTSKSDIKRMRLALRQDQLHLKEKGLELERRRLALEQERQQAIAELRQLCARYGSNAWDADTALPTILRDHLGAHLDRRAGETASRRDRPEPVAPRAAPTPPPPALLRPTAMPSQEHRCIVVRGQDRSGAGYRARCFCGWGSALAPTEDRAALDGELHGQRFAPTVTGERRA